MPLTRGYVARIPRNDLSDLYGKLEKEAAPVGFLFEKIFPEILRAQQAGRLYYQKWADFGTAQAGRAPGDAINTEQVGSTNVVYACTELNKRVQMGASEIQNSGGAVAAESVLTKRGLKATAKSLEQSAVAALGFGTATDISASDETVYAGILSAVAAMLPKVMGNVGTLTLIGGSTALNNLRKNANVLDVMKNIGVQTDSMSAFDARRVSNNALAQVFGVKEVLEGADGFWATDMVAVAYLPEASEDPTESAQLGRLIRYKDAEQTSTIEVYEGFDKDTNSDYLDFLSYIQFQILNEEFVAPLQIVPTVTT